jgi:amino acid efflux transporter
MNVYMGGAAKLTASLASESALPQWLAGDAQRSVPRRPLLLIASVGVLLLGGLLAGISSTDDLIRATSACFIAVYVLAILSALRILDGRVRIAASLALAITLALAVFSARYLAVPAVTGVAAFLLHRGLSRRVLRVADDDAVTLDANNGRPRDLVVRACPDSEPVEVAAASDAQRDHLEA